MKNNRIEMDGKVSAGDSAAGSGSGGGQKKVYNLWTHTDTFWSNQRSNGFPDMLDSLTREMGFIKEKKTEMDDLRNNNPDSSIMTDVVK